MLDPVRWPHALGLQLKGKRYRSDTSSGSRANDMQRHPSKHHFSLKGRNSEAFLHQLAQKTFLTDWCYPNPQLKSGKELCDLLVVFDTTAIIWAAKDLKLGKDGQPSRSEVAKNLRQLAGARRKLFHLQVPVALQNARRVSEPFDPSAVTEVFLVSALLGDSPDISTFATSIKNHYCHVIAREALETVLAELDTVSDFCAYLREKERVRGGTKSLVIEGGEEELLGFYLMNNRSLARLENHDYVFLEGGMWKQLQESKDYQAKKREDKVSYVWDELIDRCHTGDNSGYERVARELARPSRFERRCLGKAYFDAHIIAGETDSPGRVFRRVCSGPHATYCFLFASDDCDPESRRKLLKSDCFVVRGTFPQERMVLGIATEAAIRRESTLDYCLVDIPHWGAEEEAELKRIQRLTGTLTNPKWSRCHMDEYPPSDA